MNYLPRSQAKMSLFWSKENSLIKQSLFILFGVFILAVASQISIPLQPVPLTFQSTTVILISMLCGVRYSAYIVTAYLFAGMVGLPVFANFSSGLPTLFGPTCGYLLGFLPAAFLSGYLAQKGWGKNIFSSFVAASAGDCLIFASGVSVLALSTGWPSALAVGFLPFIPSELIKLIALSCVVPAFWKKSASGN